MTAEQYYETYLRRFVDETDERLVLFAKALAEINHE